MVSETFKLTRFLYNLQEVKLSLISSILNKRNIIECYYWFSELCACEIDMCDIIWEIYFDYYALLNPKLEYCIIKKIDEWKKTNELGDLLYIIKNMQISKHDWRVFLLRQISISDDLCQKYIYTHKRKSKEFNTYNEKYLPLLISIKKQEWIDVCYYLSKLLKTNLDKNDRYEIYKTILNYLLDVSSSSYKILDDAWNSRIDNKDFHFILKTICSLNANNLKINPDNINNRKIFVNPLKEDVEDIKSLNDIISPIYKTLPNKRWFKIDENIGSFELVRFNVKNYRNENYNWEYYASFVPLWKERIDKFKCSINHTIKRVEFIDDDCLETFYDTYGYELDEQSKEVQDCSLLEINKQDWKEWFKYIGHLDEMINCEYIGCIDYLSYDFTLK